jgi:hypothetical protein
MSITTDTNLHSTASIHRSDANAPCPVCSQLRRAAEQFRAEYVVTPADGGGWMQWSAALLRLLERTGNEPTRALIIEQPSRTRRYVQMLVGHGTAHVEASSNVYLEGPSRLSGVEERLLSLLGWSAPHSTVDRADQMPSNWSLPLAHGDWVNVVETITATIVGIFGFSEQLPVEMTVFLADQPCRSCSWGDGDDAEIDETYGTLGF